MYRTNTFCFTVTIYLLTNHCFCTCLYRHGAKLFAGFRWCPIISQYDINPVLETEWNDLHESELDFLKQSFERWIIDNKTGKWKMINCIKKWYSGSLETFIADHWTNTKFESKQLLYLILKLSVAFHTHGAPQELPAPWFVLSLSNQPNSSNKIREMSQEEWKRDNDNQGNGAVEDGAEQNDAMSEDEGLKGDIAEEKGAPAEDDAVSVASTIAFVEESKVLKQLLSMVDQEKIAFRNKHMSIYDDIKTKVSECNGNDETYEALQKLFVSVKPDWNYVKVDNPKDSWCQNLMKLQSLSNFELTYEYYSKVLKLWANTQL